MCGRSLQGTLCVVFLALSLDQCATSSVVSIDMYRAMRSIDVDSHVLNSNNLADLGGVIQFLHTYIIVESDLTVQQQGGVRRKYDMDVITKRRFKIRNSQNLLDSHWRREQDFGPYMVFDYGQAADTELYGIFKGVRALGGCSRSSRSQGQFERTSALVLRLRRLSQLAL